MAQQKFLVTGATGDTGGYTVKQLLERGHAVRALAHREDDRSKRLGKMGAEVVMALLQKIFWPHSIAGRNRYLPQYLVW